VTGRQWRFHYEPETLSAATFSDRMHLLSTSVVSSKPDRRLGDKRRSTPIQFASRLLLPRWQIGSCCTPCRTSHRLRGFRPSFAALAARIAQAKRARLK